MSFSYFSSRVDDSGIRDSLSGISLTSGTTPNVLRQLTLGLGNIYADIYSDINNGNANGVNVSDNAAITDDSDGGLLILDWNAPLRICKRFHLLKLIACGTFSQIFTCSTMNTNGNGNIRDSFLPEHGYGDVSVLKVMKLNYHLLGLRETYFLRHFTALSKHSAKVFVDIRGSFFYNGHFCMELEHCHSTLMDYLKEENSIEQDDRAGNTNNRWNDTRQGHGIMQPKVLRDPSMDSFLNPSSGSNTSMNYSHGYNANMNMQSSNNNMVDVSYHTLRHVAVHVLSALKTIHSAGVIHADIKPENIFLKHNSHMIKSHRSHNDDNGRYPLQAHSNTHNSDKSGLRKWPSDFEIRLGDFGNSIHREELCSDNKSHDIQTMPYRAPEVLLGCNFDERIDIWSFGIVMLEAAIRRPLFTSREPVEHFLNVKERLSIGSPAYWTKGVNYSALFDKKPYPRKDDGNEHNSHVDNNTIHAELLVRIKDILAESVLEISPTFVHFLATLLHPHPDMRATALEALTHPFLSCKIPFSISLHDKQQGVVEDQSLKKKVQSVNKLRAGAKEIRKNIDGKRSRGHGSAPSLLLLAPSNAKTHSWSTPSPNNTSVKKLPERENRDGRAFLDTKKLNLSSSNLSMEVNHMARKAPHSHMSHSGTSANSTGNVKARRSSTYDSDIKVRSINKELLDLQKANETYRDDSGEEDEEDEEEEEEEKPVRDSDADTLDHDSDEVSHSPGKDFASGDALDSSGFSSTPSSTPPGGTYHHSKMRRHNNNSPTYSPGKNKRKGAPVASAFSTTNTSRGNSVSVTDSLVTSTMTKNHIPKQRKEEEEGGKVKRSKQARGSSLLML